ncbi:nuclear transport factor 2 family protein [Novosphingobium resinovorum]|uniref:nuclear transport factor 2 family protein n=1 Tax=Novosphingobium resinovorum TaxID=158500 RepID=UPI002ED68E35|nr:nuclear transport factor 2 family protein [Novosphingobium resinovorum]
MTGDRLARLEAQLAIADLVHGYARAVRREAYEDIPALFAPDGTFEVRSGAPDHAEFAVRQRFETPRALMAFLLEGKGRPHPVPLIHNLIVTVEGDTAQANAMMTARITGTDRAVTGEYHDSFVRHQGRWLFAARIYTMFAA